MKNKRKSNLLIALVAILLITVFGLRKNNTISKKQLENIRKDVQQIDAIKDYEVKTLNNQQVTGGHMTDGGAQLVGYYKGEKIYKVVEKLGLSFGVTTYEYYFIDNTLVFVHEKDENFPYDESKTTFDYSKLDFAFQGFYYFESGKLIRSESSGERRFPSSEETDIGNFLIKQADENINLLSLDGK